MGAVELTVLLMGVIGIIAAILLYIAAKKFYVYEDPRIAQIEEKLPGANCGACGFKGCHDFAVNYASAKSSEGLYCPGAGKEVMAEIAQIAGLAATTTEEKIAILHCNGACNLRQKTSKYAGPSSCKIESMTFSGDTACSYGCLGKGDCVASCRFGAIRIDTETNLPVVDIEKCVGCGKCVTSCPKNLFTLVPKRISSPIVRVSCRNKDKGGIAMKECEVSCIGCGKCKRACESDAIIIEDFLASISPEKCIGCEKCIPVCPRKSINKQMAIPS